MPLPFLFHQGCSVSIPFYLKTVLLFCEIMITLINNMGGFFVFRKITDISGFMITMHLKHNIEKNVLMKC